MLLGVDDALRTLRSREVAPDALLVLGKSPRDVSRDARVERTILALKQIDEIRHLVFLRVSPERKRRERGKDRNAQPILRLYCIEQRRTEEEYEYREIRPESQVFHTESISNQ